MSWFSVSCADTANAAQTDSDGDGVGDACEPSAPVPPAPIPPPPPTNNPPPTSSVTNPPPASGGGGGGGGGGALDGSVLILLAGFAMLRARRKT